MGIITISRQFGAGGKTVGRIVAERLSYRFVDEEIIEEVANMAKVPLKWARAIENEAGGSLLKFISGLTPSRKSLIDRCMENHCGYLDEPTYVEFIHRVIKQIADEGNAVIIGRGGQYVLQGYENACHILLVADKPHRVAFMERQYHLSTELAAEVVEKMSRRRANLYKKFGKKDWDHPHLYHLVLNMSRLDVETAATLVINTASR